jgi:hypothetical protein
LLGPARSGDRPRQIARAERGEQLVCARGRPRIRVDAVVDLAAALVDGLCLVVIDGLTGDVRDLVRQALAVRADQPRDVVALGLDADLFEDLQPGLDARLDRVDERPIEVEDQPARIGQLLESAQRRLRKKMKARIRTIAIAASPTATSGSFESVTGSPSLGGGVGSGEPLAAPTVTLNV